MPVTALGAMSGAAGSQKMLCLTNILCPLSEVNLLMDGEIMVGVGRLGFSDAFDSVYDHPN